MPIPKSPSPSSVGTFTKVSFHELHRLVVTINVGKQKYPFKIHKGRLCSQSEYFRAAFDGSFQEADSQELELDDIDVDIFKIFEEWLYTEHLSIPTSSDDFPLLLAKIFCFGDRFGIDHLQKLAIKSITDKASVSFRLPISAQAAHFAYDNTDENSQLRRLFANIFALSHNNSLTMKTGFDDYPKAFLIDVLTITLQRKSLDAEKASCRLGNSLVVSQLFEGTSSGFNSTSNSAPNPNSNKSSMDDSYQRKRVAKIPLTRSRSPAMRGEFTFTTPPP